MKGYTNKKMLTYLLVSENLAPEIEKKTSEFFSDIQATIISGTLKWEKVWVADLSFQMKKRS